MGRRLDEDPGVVLLEDPHLALSLRSFPQPSPGVVLYDPLHSATTTSAPKNAVQFTPPSSRRSWSSRDDRGTMRLTRSTQPRLQFNPRDGSVYEDTLSLTTGAIRPGGSISLFSCDTVGLAIDFFIVGLIDGVARALVYPLFKIYFHMPSYEQTAAAALLGFGWSCKFGFGFLSDCVPIRGQRRRPYALLALVLLLAFTTGIALMPTIEPYENPRGTIVNADAPRQSGKYVVLVMLASFGHALLGAACEGLMVEYAHHEGEFERGYVQGTMYSARYVGTVLGSLLVSLGCNSPAYGGDFAYVLSLNAIVGVLACVSAMGLYATYFHMADGKVVHGTQPLYSHARSIGRFAERRATWQLTLVFFLQSLVFLYKVPQSDTIYERWLHGDTLTRSLSYTLSSGMFVCGTLVLRSDLLRNTSWRKTIIVATVVSTATGLVSASLVVGDIYRSKFVALLLSQVVNFCDTFPWMIGVLVIVEIAEPGYEASSYALLTTIYNLAVPIATAAGNAVSAGLALDDSAIVEDSTSVRRRVLSHYIIMYALRVVVGLGVVFFLPPQKRAVKLLLERGNPNAAVPLVVMVAFLVLFVATWSVVILSMFRATACHVGGSGC